MTYSDAQAERVRKELAGRSGIVEKEMFGGIAFLLGGNMAVGVRGDDLIVRVDPSQTDALLREPGARPFDLSGSRTWVARGVSYASSLPKKKPKPKR